MKFVVDSLPYYGYSCSFAVFECPYSCDKIKCPRYWDKEFICSNDNPHECKYLIEFDKYMGSKKNENS